MERNRKIIIVSIQGIVVNLLLVVFKIIVGLLANSIAIILDAVNNFSDALSSVITIIGTKIAGKAPDKDHPYGYGRIEYVSSITIAIIVLLAGFSSLKESVFKIIRPETANYTAVSLIIIAVAVVVKFLFGGYVKKAGESINAQSLVASGTDAVMDSVISLGTLIAAIISILWHINLEGLFGTVISIFILKAGIEILKETLGSIIGLRVDSEFATKIKDKINSYEQVRGAYDLILNDYGPNQMIGSIRVEVDDDMTAKEIHALTRDIGRAVFEQFGVILTVGIYASNTDDNRFMHIKSTILEEIKDFPEILQIHGFYVDSQKNIVSFDIVVDFKADDAIGIRDVLYKKLREIYQDYEFHIIIDNDYSD